MQVGPKHTMLQDKQWDPPGKVNTVCNYTHCYKHTTLSVLSEPKLSGICQSEQMSVVLHNMFFTRENVRGLFCARIWLGPHTGITRVLAHW